MKKIKIGFFSVGIDGAFDQKVAKDNFKAGTRSFRALAKEHKFEKVICEEIVRTREAMSAFLERCAGEGVRMMVLHTASFTSGGIGQQAAWFAREHPMPFVIWGVPERAGGPLPVNNLCCTNFMTSIFYSMGVPFKWVWGEPDSGEVKSELGASADVARAIAALRDAAIVVVGSGRVPGFYGSNFDEAAIKSRYGVHVERVPLTDLYKMFFDVNTAQKRAALQKIKNIGAKCKESEEAVERSARMYAALKKIAGKYGAAGLAVRCWPELRDDLGAEACLPMGMLGDDGIPCSCEADVPGVLTMMLQYELTRRAAGPPALLDMVSVGGEGESVGLWHCGVTSPSLGLKKGMEICRHNVVEQCDPDAEMGLVLESAMKVGPATICRLQGDAADRCLAVQGRVLKCPPTASRGSYAEFQPETISAPDLLNTVMTQGITHHYSLAYTHHQRLIDEAAYWLDLDLIEPNPADARNSKFGMV